MSKRFLAILLTLALVCMFALPSSAVPILDPPTPVITPLETPGIAAFGEDQYPLAAEYIFSFREGEPTEEQKEAYGNWSCDFIVSFDRDVAANSMGLYGRYGEYEHAQMTEDEITAGERIALIDTFGYGSDVTLDVLVEFVQNFDCGVFDVDYANAGTTMTVTLRMTNPENTEEWFDLATEPFTFPSPDPPTPLITPVETPGTATVEGEQYPLAAEYIFGFQDGEPTAAQLAVYGDWLVEYFVKFDNDVEEASMGLFGTYEAWGEAVSFLNPGKINANEEIPLVTTMVPNTSTLTLNDLYTFVQSFDCGVFDVDYANAGTTMTVELRLWNPENVEESYSNVTEFTFPSPNPPTPLITPVETPGTATVEGEQYPLAAEYIFGFQDGEPTAAQLAVYGDWLVEYFVKFDNDVEEASMGLFGTYEAWGEAVSFLNPGKINANEEIPLVTTMVPNTSTLTLNDLYTFVQSFDCGVFDVDYANAGTTMTVELRLWNPENVEESYSDVTEFIFPSPPVVELPEAVIEEVEPRSIRLNDESLTLDAEYIFKFKDGEPTQAQLAAFGDWYCEYFVSFDNDVAAESLGLFGEYGGNSMSLKNPDAIIAGEEIELVSGVVGNTLGMNSYWTLSDVAALVEQFDCGVVNLSEDNVGTTMHVELRLWDSSNPEEKYTVAEQEYTFGELADLPEAVVTPLGRGKTVEDGGYSYQMEAEYLFTFKEGEPTEAQLAKYGDWNCDFIVSFDRDVNAEAVGMYGQYGDYELMILNPEPVSAGQELVLVKGIVGGDYGYGGSYWSLRDIAEVVGTFDCGVVNLMPRQNAGTTMTVELRIWKDGEEPEKHTLAIVEYTFGEMNQVTVSSQDTNGITGVAPVSGGGTYAKGDYVSVTASEAAGYDFLGWYTDINGEPISTNRTYSFQMGLQPVSLIALYEPNGFGLLTVKGQAFMVVSPENKYYTDRQDFDYPAGQVVTLRYVGENFVYWVNASGNIVSTEREYTFTFAGYRTIIEAYYSTAQVEGADPYAELFFHNAYKQVSDKKQVLEEDLEDGVSVFPEAPPTKMGYDFVQWVFGDEYEAGTEVADTEAISAKLAEATENIVLHIWPEYVPVANGESQYTVNVWVDEKSDVPIQVLTANIGETIVVTKALVARWTANTDDPVSEDDIRFWSLDGESAAGFDVQYTALSANAGEVIDVYAMRRDEEAKPVLLITQMFGTKASGKYKVSTTMKYNVPEGYTVLESGFVFTADDSYANNPDGLVIDANNVKKHISNLTSQSVTYTVNISTGSDPNKTVFIKAFLTFQAPGSNTVETIYSELSSGSYNSLQA